MLVGFPMTVIGKPIGLCRLHPHANPKISFGEIHPTSPNLSRDFCNHRCKDVIVFPPPLQGKLDREDQLEGEC